MSITYPLALNLVVSEMNIALWRKLEVEVEAMSDASEINNWEAVRLCAERARMISLQMTMLRELIDRVEQKVKESQT